MSVLPAIFGDDTRVEIIRLLSEHPEGRPQAWISHRTGRAPSHVHRVVQALHALGLVTFDEPRNVRLDPQSPLYEPTIETLARFTALEGLGRYLRTVIRAANERFDDRVYVGGYLAATRTVQPIDFHSDRADLYVKGLVAKDQAWLRQVRHLSPYDVRLHGTDRISGYVEEGATVDDESCLVAYPEVGAAQCLFDDTFPRYGAFLLFVQGIDEWAKGEGGYQPQRLDNLAREDPRWDSGQIRALIDHIEGQRSDPPDILTPAEKRELKNAIETVRGGP